MVSLKLSQPGFDVILFIAQVISIYIVIASSIYNLTRGVENKELWVSLLSSSVGYLLPSPVISKHVPHTTE